MQLSDKMIRQLIRSWIGDLNVTVDREKKIVSFAINGQPSQLTVDQVIDKVEEFFGTGKPSTGLQSAPGSDCHSQG